MRIHEGALLALAGIAAVAAAACVALPEAAAAQSGSRLCGYITTGAGPGQDGYTGYLFEARQADSDYHTQCYNAALDMYKKHVDPVSELFIVVQDCHNLPEYFAGWHRHCENTCEDVGVNFQSSNSPKDMCDKMEAHKKYKVVFDKATNTTTYTKLD